MDCTLVDLKNTYSFLVDIVIVSTGSQTDQINYVVKCLKKLDEDHLYINKLSGYPH